MFIFVVLLLAVLIWMAVTYRSRMAVRDCRWRENRSKDGPKGSYFHCIHCGAETWTTDGKQPKHCLRSERS